MVSDSNIKNLMYDTLYTGPKPPSPSLLDKWKLLVAVASFPKSNSISSCSLIWDRSPITPSLVLTSDVPPLLNSRKALFLFFLVDLVECHCLAGMKNVI
jgi:hypothetical protein